LRFITNEVQPRKNDAPFFAVFRGKRDPTTSVQPESFSRQRVEVPARPDLEGMTQPVVAGIVIEKQSKRHLFRRETLQHKNVVRGIGLPAEKSRQEGVP
jgi:hypothetical protein